MKSFIVVSLALLCVSTLSIPQQPPRLNIREVQNPRVIGGIRVGTQMRQANNGSDFLCDPCKHFFSVLKDIVGDVSDLTKDTLTNALNVTCKYLEGSVPFIDQVCEDFGPTFIDILYNYLTEIDKEINPLHDCKLLLLCWGDKKAQKQAFQEMILKNKINLD